MRRTVRPHQGYLVDPEAHGLRRDTEEVELRAIVGGKVPGGLGAPTKPQQSEHNTMAN